MPTASESTNVSIAGMSIQGTRSRTATGQIAHQVSLPAGKAGTLTTRTDDNTGEATLGAGHGLQQNDVVDVLWSGGVRYGMDVGVVVGTVAPIDGGAGDVLPVQDTVLIVTKVVTIDTDFDGDLMKMIAAHSTKRAHLAFRDSVPTVLKAVELSADEPWSWVSDAQITNPLTGNPVNDIRASNGASDAAATLKIGVLYESQS